MSKSNSTKSKPTTNNKPSQPPPRVEAALAASRKLVASWYETMAVDLALPMAAILEAVPWFRVSQQTVEHLLALLLTGLDDEHRGQLEQAIAREQRSADLTTAEVKLAERIAEATGNYELADELARAAREAFA